MEGSQHLKTVALNSKSDQQTQNPSSDHSDNFKKKGR